MKVRLTVRGIYNFTRTPLKWLIYS